MIFHNDLFLYNLHDKFRVDNILKKHILSLIGVRYSIVLEN